MIKEAQAAYAEGVFSALSQMDLDEEVKIAAVQHLEKVAGPAEEGLLSRIGTAIANSPGQAMDYLGGAGSNVMKGQFNPGEVAALLGAGGLGAAGLYGAYKGLTSDPVVSAARDAKDALVSGVEKVRGGNTDRLSAGEIAALSGAGLLGAGAVGGLGYGAYKGYPMASEAIRGLFSSPDGDGSE